MHVGSPQDKSSEGAKLPPRQLRLACSLGSSGSCSSFRHLRQADRRLICCWRTCCSKSSLHHELEAASANIWQPQALCLQVVHSGLRPGSAMWCSSPDDSTLPDHALAGSLLGCARHGRKQTLPPTIKLLTTRVKTDSMSGKAGGALWAVAGKHDVVKLS